ncbi:MAG: hypothetical protein LBC84_10235 [Prevotellaceae bacterium]|jgi:hypothetical protein|nr:hypothetical protein [Prevotellaceae bacterium]
MENKSNMLLKVTAILMIIGGIFISIVGIIAVVGTGVIAAIGINSGLLMTASVLALLSGIVNLIAGIVGVGAASKPQKASKCIFWGSLVVLLCVASNALSMVGGLPLNFTSLAIGLVLPGLYLLGAFQLKKKAA